MGVASLILGIISIILGIFGSAWGWLGITVGVLGIIFGAVGKKNPEKAGVAKAGLVLSIIGTVLSALLYIACIACVGAALGTM